MVKLLTFSEWCQKNWIMLKEPDIDLIKQYDKYIELEFKKDNVNTTRNI